MSHDSGAPISHRERRPAQLPIESEELPSMLHIKSHSEVPLNDFKNVDSQLASIKQQLEDSKNKQRTLFTTAAAATVGDAAPSNPYKDNPRNNSYFNG